MKVFSWWVEVEYGGTKWGTGGLCVTDGAIVEFWEYNEHNVDGKGRLVLPSSFRDAFDRGGVLSFQGSFVAIHDPAGWDKARRRMEDSGDYTKKELYWLRSFVTNFTPDSQNRVMLPARLREAVGVEREVALVGQGSFIAVYPRDVWHRLEDELTAASDGRPSLSDRLSEALQ
jgi:MraZ protein